MTYDIFYRTYCGDAKWLDYSLQSIHKFVTGYSSVIVTAPESSKEVIEPIVLKHGFKFIVCDAIHADDYVGQQVTKMYADLYTTSDLVVHVDSDVIFTKHVTLQSFLNAEGTKPLNLKTLYVDIVTPWKSITERNVKFDVQYEYMRRIPLTYPRESYKNVREYIEKVHGITFYEFIHSITNGEMSEFNIIGAVLEQYYPNCIEWQDTHGTVPMPEPFAMQYWSWGGLENHEKEIQRILA
tara:strand:- start:72 stop:788 length:717 start_codon:yes stop_codon:yes gene_type:complete